MSKILIYQGQVPNTSTELYAAERLAAIHAATVCNTSASDATLSIWVAMDGGAAADGNKVYDDLSIVAGDSVSLANLVNHALPTGAKIYGQAQTASALTLTVSGTN